MILPRRLLLLPLISSVLVTHAQAADASGKSAPAPTTSAVAPKEKSPAVTAEDFGRFAPLYDDLANDPANKAALEFFVASKNRILGIPDRSAPSNIVLDRFQKKFPQINKAPVALRVAMANMLLNQNAPFFPDKSPIIQKLLVAPGNEASLTRALRLAASVKWHKRMRENINQATSLDPLFNAQKQLRDDILGMSPETVAALRDDTLLDLLEPFFSRNQLESTKVEAQYVAEEATCRWLESIPPESRRAPHEVVLGNYYTDKAWHERGTRFADKTSNEQFAAFDKYLRVAAAHYHKAIEKNPRTLVAYQGLITISMASPEIAGGDETHWYELCEKLSPDNETSIRLYIFASRQRWGKPKSNLLNFIARVRKEGRYDTVLPHFCIAATSALVDEPLEDAERESLVRLHIEVALEVSNRYLDDARNGAPKVVGQDGYALNDYSKFIAALKLTEYEEGIPFIAQLHPETKDKKLEARIDREIAKSVASTRKDAPWTLMVNLKDEYFNSYGSDGQEVRLRSDLARIDSFINRARDIEKKNDPNANDIIRHIILPSLLAEKAFVEGKPVTLAMRKGKSFNPATAHGWEYGKDFAKAKDLRVPSSIFGTRFELFAPPYEVSCKIRDIRLAQDAYFGVHVGRVATGETGRSFLLNKQSGGWVILRGKAPDITSAKVAGGHFGELPEELTVTLRVFAHGYAFFVNGKPVHAARDEEFAPKFISLGTSPKLLTTGSLIYQEPVIRKLKPEEMTAKESEWMRDAES